MAKELSGTAKLVMAEMEIRFRKILQERDDIVHGKFDSLTKDMITDREDRRSILDMLRNFLGKDGEFKRLEKSVEELQKHIKWFQIICSIAEIFKTTKAIK